MFNALIRNRTDITEISAILEYEFLSFSIYRISDVTIALSAILASVDSSSHVTAITVQPEAFALEASCVRFSPEREKNITRSSFLNSCEKCLIV